MRKFGDTDLVPLDLESEQTVRQIKKGKKEQTEVEQKSMVNVKGFKEGEEVDIQSINREDVPQIAPPMEDLEKSLRDYAFPSSDIAPMIRRLAIQANNFELKPITLQLFQNIQFIGFPNEDLNMHISNFLEVCDTVKYNRVSDDAIHLRLFPFSLKDKAKHWLNLEPPDSITSWDSLVHKFLSKFFPLEKATGMRIEIHNFSQYE